MADDKKPFLFAISLSVLNHLGRNLYRSFATVLGEAISNSWDADAKNVWIYINRDENHFYIKDDGNGMTADDFQTRFLKIGYSKRKEGEMKSKEGRPFIGRKGIGKLALLSCAQKITVISKTLGGEYVGGVIDNSGLDQAIHEDLKPEEYSLEDWNPEVFGEKLQDHEKGTIIYFDGIKDGIRNTIGFLKKIVALYFRFSLIDKDFTIWINDEKVDSSSLEDLASKTEFLWKINELEDSYVKGLENRFTPEKNEVGIIKVDEDIKGFIASVSKPRDLKIITTEERVRIDLFVNGRLREHDIMKHMPTARIAENYLYGQLHFNMLDSDDGADRFTSSREGVVADDPVYQSFLETVRNKIINIVIQQWDEWRIKHRKDGDSENDDIPKKKRKSQELFNAVTEEYQQEEDAPTRARLEEWLNELAPEAEFNFSSYADCFLSENLIRKYMHAKGIPLNPRAQNEVDDWKDKENRNKIRANINIDIMGDARDTNYLGMDTLAFLTDNAGTPNNMVQDAITYKPMRNAVMHTAVLSNVAKLRLNAVYENIKGRIRTLLSLP